MPVMTNCLVCGKEIKVKPSHAAKGAGKYCSRKCMAIEYGFRMKGEANPNYSDAGHHICPTCGNDFISYKKRARFCSVKCRANAPEMKELSRRLGLKNIQKAIERNRNSPKKLVQASLKLRQINMNRYVCVVCGKTGWSYQERSVCSRECAGNLQRKRIALTCVVCGKVFDVPRSVVEYHGAKTCSRNCLRVFRSVSQQGEKSHRWK